MRTMHFQDIAVAFLALAACTASAAPLPILAYEFESDGDAEGWYDWNDVGPISVAGGELAFEITGPDPFVGGPVIALDAADYGIVLIGLTVPVEGSGQLFWGTAAESGMSQDKSAAFATGAAGTFSEIVVDPSATATWAGTISQLRIDVPGGAGAGTAAIDYVRILPRSFRFDFDSGGDTEGWSGWHNVGPVTASGGLLAFDIIDVDPYVGSSAFSAPAAMHRFLITRFRQTVEGTCQVFWSTEDEPGMNEAKSHRFQSGLQGLFKEYVIDLSEKEDWQGVITRLRFDPPSDAESGSVDIDYVAISSFVPPTLDVATFSAGSAVVNSVGSVFDVALNLGNIGTEAAHNVQATLDLPAGTVLDGPALTQVIPIVDGQGGAEVIWQVHANQAAAGIAEVSITADDATGVVAFARVFVDDSPPTGSWMPASGVGVQQDGDNLWLGNEHVRAVFPESGLGYGHCAFDVRLESGDWRRMAVLPSFSFLALDHGATQERTALFASNGVIVESGPSQAELRFIGSHQDDQGEDWNFTYGFSLDAASQIIDVAYTAEALGGGAVLAFEGPMLYTGVGSFGAAKDSAVLPGLEWLSAEESSSNMLDDRTATHIRYVPDTRKITMPVMSLAWQDSAVGLAWDPLAAWHGASQEPSPVFAVPDHFEGKEAGLLGLFVPSTRTHVTENEREARSGGYAVGVGETITLASEIVLAAPADGPLAVQDVWMARHGHPDPLPYPRGTLDGELEFTMKAFLDNLWIPAEQQWEMYLDGGTFFDAQGRPAEFILWLELAARFTDDPVLAQAYRDRYAEAIAAGGGTGGFHAPFYMGDADLHMLHTGNYAQTLINQQWEDGSWRFDADRELTVLPGETAAYLGPDDAAELGTCAASALIVVRFARMSGDPVATEHGLLALEFMTQFEIPRAAQIWEVPVHTPDVLASAYGVEAFLEGYLLTGDERWREEAVYWGRAILPFLYTWYVPGFEFMQQASIPVFGATLYVGPWYARPVQWNGLAAAQALLHLAGHDDSHDWGQIATGVLVSGMYQQDPAPGHEGTYRDWFDTRTGASGGPLINPGLFMAPIFTTYGWDPTPRTLKIYEGDYRVHVTTGARVTSGMKAEGDIVFDLEYLDGELAYTVVSGLTEPESVLMDGAPLAELEDLESGDNGWRYQNSTGLIGIKTLHGIAPVHISIQGAHARRTQILGDIRDRIAFYFDDDGGFEGWIPQHDLSGPAVAGGSFTATTLSGDPYAVRGGLEVPADAVDTLVIRMRTSAGNALQLHWLTPENPGFSENAVLSYPIVSDGEFHVYTIDIGAQAAWAGHEILGIRIDPANATGSAVAIDFILGGQAGDVDGDGIPGQDEVDNGIDPYHEDSDRDGVNDGDEVFWGQLYTPGTPYWFAQNEDVLGEYGEGSPIEPNGTPDGQDDTDGDGVSNADEVTAGTNPFDGIDVSRIASPVGFGSLAPWVAAAAIVLLHRRRVRKKAEK